MNAIFSRIYKTIPAVYILGRQTVKQKWFNNTNKNGFLKPLLARNKISFFKPLLPLPFFLEKRNDPSSNLSTDVSDVDVEENIAHLMALARLALEKGDIERAEAILLMGIKISEEYKNYTALPFMYDILASIAFATGRLRKAESLLVEVIEKMVKLGIPEDDTQIIDFKLRLSRIYSAYNQYELAEIGFQSCLNAQRDKIVNGDTSTKTGLLYVNCMFWYGFHKIKLKEFKDAKKLIRQAYDYSVKIKGLSPYQEMVILYTLGELNMELQEYNVALQNMQSAILMARGIGSLDLPRCYIKLAKIYQELDGLDNAISSADEGLKLAKLFNDKTIIEEAENLLLQLHQLKNKNNDYSLVTSTP